MAYTNSYYDDSKVKQYMDENTYIGQYTFHVPGNGKKPCYVSDPHVRLTHWGANRWTNNLYIDDQLKNRGRYHRRTKYEYTLNDLRQNIEGNAYPEEYPICNDKTFETEQSRALMPSWTLRDSTAHQFYERHFPLRNPLEHILLDQLPVPIWSRNVFKDEFMRRG